MNCQLIGIAKFPICYCGPKSLGGRIVSYINKLATSCDQNFNEGTLTSERLEKDLLKEKRLVALGGFDWALPDSSRIGRGVRLAHPLPKRSSSLFQALAAGRGACR